MKIILRFLYLLSQRTDIALAVLIVAIVFMMILPLPTTLVDILIASNMGIAVTLLMVAVYLRSPLDFAAFPSVLLISTLFRLALSISTTRLILLQADAGEIIFAFGNFVVGGNLVVGVVVFLIITIVQFIVVTKGAERVAEVSARFSLDAMPGKQMSIDGDMRAGLIDMEEARRRRQLVEKESQLFGSMDGAMKFVKGDAIAGIIIVTVNMIGGITIGVLQRGLSVAESLKIYSILTIGDGLIGQIPGLFIAITAGIIVTRVTSEDSKDLSSDIVSQISREPKALAVAASILLFFGLVPGFPTPVFFALSMALGIPTWFALRAQRQAAAAIAEDSTPGLMPDVHDSKAGGKAPTKRSAQSERFVLTVPLLIDISPQLEENIDIQVLNRELIEARRALYLDFGVPFPGIKLRFNPAIANNTYVILLQEIPVSQGILSPGDVFVRETPENLDLLSIPYRAEKRFLPDLDTIWVEKTHSVALEESGVSTMGIPEVLIYHLSFVLKRHADAFIGIQETYFLLNNMEGDFPDLVKEFQRILPMQKTTEIFHRLVSEDISIRDLRTVLEALIEWGQKEKDTVLLTEYVRTGMGRQISYQFSGGSNILPAFLLSTDIEDKIRSSIRQTSGGSYLALDPQDSQKILDAIKDTVGDLDEHMQKPVIVTATDVRRYVRKLIELEIYELPVLSFQELTPEITVQPLARVTLDAVSSSAAPSQQAA